MDHTLNYNLKKPLPTENIIITDINENMDVLDTKLKEVDNKVDNIDFSSLQTQIDKKADKVHTHTISDITNLQTTLNGKASSSHTHSWDSIISKPSTFTPSTHNHAISDVTDLQTTLNSKANQSDVTAHLGVLATSTTLGHVKVGSNISVASGIISVNDSSTTVKGVVQLSNSTSSTSTTLAATPYAVKLAYDLAQSAKTDGNNVKSDVVAALLAIDNKLAITSNSTWNEIKTAISTIFLGKKFVTGTSTAGSLGVITVTGLDFKPNMVIVKRLNDSGPNYYVTVVTDTNILPSGTKVGLSTTTTLSVVNTNFQQTANGFSLRTQGDSGNQVEWYAAE